MSSRSWSSSSRAQVQDPVEDDRLVDARGVLCAPLLSFGALDSLLTLRGRHGLLLRDRGYRARTLGRPGLVRDFVAGDAPSGASGAIATAMRLSIRYVTELRESRTLDDRRASTLVAKTSFKPSAA